MINIIKSIKIIIFNVLLIELFCFCLILFSYIPSGLSLMTSAISNKEFSLIHYPDRKYSFSSECWDSSVYYNNEGNREYANKPSNIKIALLGDSMTENAQLSDGEDLGSLLQKKLGNKYQVTNFGMFSTGIYDHYQIYKKKILKEYDILIYFPDTTDITDNHISRNRSNQNMFQIRNNQIVKVEQDEKFWSWYTSTYNKVKRKYFFYIKKYSSSYKAYWTLKERWGYLKQGKDIKLNDDDANIKRIKEPLIIYDHFSNLFVQELKRNGQKHIIVQTLKPNIFNKSKYNTYRYKKINDIWSSKTERYFDAYFDAINYMKKKDIYSYPYLSWTCDSHYSHAGADFFSDFVARKIVNLD